jgi:hypothetical protein
MMKSKIFLICVFLIGILFIVPEQNIAHAQQPDVGAMDVAAYHAYLPPSATGAQATTLQDGYMSWYSIISNDTQAPLTNGSISVMSGYDPFLFNSVPSFPFTTIFPVLTPGEHFAGQLNSSSSENMIPATFSLGYNSTKTVSPKTIPVGGTQQTVTVTVTPIDSRFSGTGAAGTAFHINLGSEVPGVTVVSATYDPANESQGERVETSQESLLEWWHLYDPKINKTYTFTAVLNIPNQYGIAFEFQPIVRLYGDSQTLQYMAYPGTTVTIPDPTLDGPVPGSGAVTFSIAETGHFWLSKHSDMYSTEYAGTQPPSISLPTNKDQCKKGGWQSFAVFKNQGDCVSYVSTHGKNPPANPLP